MEVLVPGHTYLVSNVENQKNKQTIQFINKQRAKDGYDLLTIHDGTTNEEILEVLIDRMIYLNNKVSCAENFLVIANLMQSLELLKKRTKDRQDKGIEGTGLKDKVFNVDTMSNQKFSSDDILYLNKELNNVEAKFIDSFDKYIPTSSGIKNEYFSSLDKSFLPAIKVAQSLIEVLKDPVQGKNVLPTKNFYEYCVARTPQFFNDKRKYLRYVCNVIQKTWGNEIKNKEGIPFKYLIINLPPGTGQDTIQTHFNWWIEDKNKTNDITRQAKVLNFNHSKLRYLDNSVFTKDDKTGRDYVTPENYSINGKGFHILFIGNLVKNKSENKKYKLEPNYTFYRDALVPRLYQNALTIVLVNRTHPQDITGMIKANVPSSEVLTVTIKDTDLMKENTPGFTFGELCYIVNKLDSIDYQARYEQNVEPIVQKQRAYQENLK